jgi:hypothetical protein
MAISGFSIAAKTIVDMTCGPFPVARRILTAPLKDETDRQLIRTAEFKWSRVSLKWPPAA